MEKNDFYLRIAESYFSNLSCEFEAFKNMVKGVLPVFGKLEVEIMENNEEKVLYFKDIDKADFAIGDAADLTEEDLDMSTTPLILTLDKETNAIRIVEHGISFFTPANKNLVLWLGSLIGKKITF